MKTKFLTLVSCIFICTQVASAQNHDSHHNEWKSKKENVKAMKIAHITQELDLSTEEAQKFWPVYNEYTNKKEALYKEMRKDKKAHGNMEETSDKELEATYQKHYSIKKQLLDLELTYHEKFKEVLPLRKVIKLHHSEEGFKRTLLKKMKEHHPKAPKAPKEPKAPK